MNILVVSETFVGGGLETHIHSYYEALREEHTIIFAFGRFKNRLPMDMDAVHTGFHFKRDSTIQEFIEDVENLQNLIIQEKIDVIHVHPYFSIYPALIASQLTGVPIALTYHGAASFSFAERIIEAAWYYYGMYELFGKIFTVCNTGKKALERQFHRNDICFLPNAVDLNQYKRHQVINNRRWAAVSRLDADSGKTQALIRLIDTLPQLDIDHVDIYGDGTCKQELIEYVQSKNLTDRVSFLGFHSDLFDRLNGKYNGIIGIGRVVVEGMAMGYPVLVLGHGCIIGVLDNQMLKALKHANFSPNRIRQQKESSALNAQLNVVYRDPAAFDMRHVVEQEFNIKTIVKTYMEELEKIQFFPRNSICEFYRELCQTSNKSELFFQSKTVYILMRKFVEYYAGHSDIKNLFLVQRIEEQLDSQIVNHVNGLNWRINKQDADMVQHVNGLNWRIDQLRADHDSVLRSMNAEQAEALHALNSRIDRLEAMQEDAIRAQNAKMEQLKIEQDTMFEALNLRITQLKAEMDENIGLSVYLKRFIKRMFRKIRQILLKRDAPS